MAATSPAPTITDHTVDAPPPACPWAGPSDVSASVNKRGQSKNRAYSPPTVACGMSSQASTKHAARYTINDVGAPMYSAASCRRRVAHGHGSPQPAQVQPGRTAPCTDIANPPIMWVAIEEARNTRSGATGVPRPSPPAPTGPAIKRKRTGGALPAEPTSAGRTPERPDRPQPRHFCGVETSSICPLPWTL